MNIERNGIILNTERYDECVNFYSIILNLPILFQLNEEHSHLTCFEFGGAYLMIEKEGVAKDSVKSIEENPTKLRFNVSNVDDALCHLNEMGISAKVSRHAWGSTINICDPDGNRIGIRDEASFKSQIQNNL